MHTKHIHIQYHYIWDKIINKKIKFVYMAIELILADNLTKPLFYMELLNFIKKIYMK